MPPSERITGDSSIGRRYADRLVKVWSLAGAEVWLLRFIDWLIRLPPPLELALRQELAELEEQTKMSYVTSWERFAREEGRHEGKAHALLRLLEAKFGPPPAALAERVRAAPIEQLDAWLMRVLTAERIEQVFDPS